MKVNQDNVEEFFHEAYLNNSGVIRIFNREGRYIFIHYTYLLRREPWSMGTDGIDLGYLHHTKGTAVESYGSYREMLAMLVLL